MFRKNVDLSVYFICDPSLCAERDPLYIARDAVKGGATLIQLRDKSGDCLELARQMISANLGVPILINDHVQTAIDIDADGVHLGQSDMSAAEARALLGPGKIIGITAFTSKHIAAIDPNIVDYIGTGPFYETQTDKGKPVLGAEKFAELIKQSPVPVAGIGGITPQNAKTVINAGANGIAMMRSISMADNPEQVAKQFKVIYT